MKRNRQGATPSTTATPKAAAASTPAAGTPGDPPVAPLGNASPFSPKLEKWPGFPCPSKAFARATPVENPKGVLPPSQRLLRYIHLVGWSCRCWRVRGDGEL